MSNVIGSGLLGRSFRSLALPGALYFCSGVSDSKETRASEFNRERELLLSVCEETQTFSSFVYFSSIMAPDRANKYFEHKYNMEELVRSLFPEKYLIVRLPQVVGMVKNTTLFPELVRRIHGGLPVLVQRNATRSLIDIDDVVRITNKLIEVGARGLEINCIPDETLSVSDIVDFISDEIGCPADRVCVDEGVAQDADSRLMRQYLCEEDPVLLPGYTRFVVSKYAKKLIDDEARKPT